METSLMEISHILKDTFDFAEKKQEKIFGNSKCSWSEWYQKFIHKYFTWFET